MKGKTSFFFAAAVGVAAVISMATVGTALKAPSAPKGGKHKGQIILPAAQAAQQQASAILRAAHAGKQVRRAASDLITRPTHSVPFFPPAAALSRPARGRAGRRRAPPAIAAQQPTILFVVAPTPKDGRARARARPTRRWHLTM